MTQKKPKPERKSKIEVPTRTPEKRNIFANLGKDRSSDRHPLREILNFSATDLDDRNISSLDDQIDKLGDQVELDLVAQTNSQSDDQISDFKTTRILQTGQPNGSDLDDQTENIGRPSHDYSDDRATKPRTRTTKKVATLGDPATENKSLGDQKTEKQIDWKKYDQKRSTARIGLRPNAEILEKIKIFCVKKKMELTEFFEVAAVRFMDLDDQKQGSLVVWSSFDERRLMMGFKTKPNIINLYLRYNALFNTSGKWKSRDDEVAREYNDVDIALIELGIIQAQINKYQSDPTGSINSFKYYRQEIENFVRLGIDEKTIQTILQINRDNWKKITNKEIDLTFLNEDAD